MTTQYDDLMRDPYVQKVAAAQRRASVEHQQELKDARECLFAAGGLESDLGPRDDAKWYWRRAAKLWRDRAEQCEEPDKESVSSFTPLSGVEE